MGKTMQKTRKNRVYSAEFKMKIMRELQSGKTMTLLAREYQLHESQISRWNEIYKQSPHDAFTYKRKKNVDAARMAELERTIGRLHVENDILKEASKLLEEKLYQIRKSKSVEL